MKKYFMGMLAVMLAIAPVLVAAGEFPIEAQPGNLPPQIYLIKKVFDICNPDTNPGPYTKDTPYTPAEDYGKSGQTPWGDQTIQYGGCVDTEDDKRFNQYAFTGEQILELVVVRDLNGAIDILSADVVVDLGAGAEPEAKCNDVTRVFDSNLDGVLEKTSWFGHNVGNNFDSTPPAKGPSDEQGYDPDFDKIFECVLTVEPQWYGGATVSVVAVDQAGDETPDGGILQQWFFNPAVILDLFTTDGAPSIWFESGVPGQTVLSGNKLKIANLAEGGVDLLVWIAADDLTDPSSTAAKCPISNVLDVEATGTNTEPEGLDFRCKIGTLADNEWNDITNKNTKKGCTYGHDYVLDPNDPESEKCYGAKPLLDDFLQLLLNQHEAECAFRLTYPVPCIGSFTQGLLHVIVRTI